MSEMRNDRKHPSWKTLFAFEGITLGLGGAVAFLTRESMSVYDQINKPSFAPPPWLFPVAWTILYALMALAAWLIWRDKKPGWRATTVLYFAQLAVNLVWPIIFFTLHAFGLAFLWLVLLWCLTVFLLMRAFSSSRAAFLCLVPYILWTTFACVLSFAVSRLN